MKLRILFLLMVLAAADGAAEGGWAPPEAFAGRRVVEIVLAGNQQTRDQAILRELYTLPGEPLDLELLRRDQRFLEGLGIFFHVDAEVLPRDGGVVLRLRLEERSRGSTVMLYPSLEIDRDLDWKASITFHHRNLRGLREDFRVRRTLGWEDELNLSLRRPWLGDFPLEHRIGYSFRERDDEDVPDDLFREERLSLTLYLPLDREHPLAHRFMLGGQLGRRDQEDSDGLWRERIPSVTLGYLQDSRRSYLRPRRGGQFHAYLVVFHPRMDSSHDLKQGVLRLIRYRSLGTRTVLAGKLELGQQWGDLYHRAAWSLGGASTVRGWSSGEISGWNGADGVEGALGRHRLVAQGELRLDLFSRRRFSAGRLGSVDIEGEVLLFADAGMLWREGPLWLPDEGHRGAWGAGMGLRFFSPFGDVLRIELGFNELGEYRLHLGSRLPF